MQCSPGGGGECACQDIREIWRSQRTPDDNNMQKSSAESSRHVSLWVLGVVTVYVSLVLGT